ncbi:MAG TPA: translation initiation factor IF-6 [Methanospirillum sp.]|uniref:translation initiation factor IF-6 n=1 Tax=Methanospirillum sp. TaxID=45200 RepID=UPI002C6497BA|nr:translation initiation factor IF-6 [Methanospirillum sp.]HOJ96809.1 translation initiation factor IF-6 [Methanospirillum sp.]HOL41732.1 translation initiation factor IF-6 [Methanospirillum sp.]HPP78134.1 translation initiation factor IF-6 [Methanospirillum sp.]
MDRFVSIAGDPHIGVFTRVFDDIAVVPPDIPEEVTARYEEALQVEIVRTTIQKSPIIGSLLAGNNHGLVVTGMATEEEIQTLSPYRDLMLLEEGMNAAGNIILANDHFAAVHPDMDEELMDALGDFLNVPVIPLTLGDVKTVGMAAVATNTGVVVSPRSTPGEIQILEQVCDLPIGKGSVSMGNAMVGTGLVANRHGYLAGVGTSGYELGRIEDILGFEEE